MFSASSRQEFYKNIEKVYGSGKSGKLLPMFVKEAIRNTQAFVNFVMRVRSCGCSAHGNGEPA